MNPDDVKAQERRNRQMARGGVQNMPSDLVQESQQLQTATTTTTNNSGSGNGNSAPPLPGPQSRNGTPGSGMSDRTRQRMEEEDRLKARARQGRAMAKPVRLPSDLVPGASGGQLQVQKQQRPVGAVPQQHQSQQQKQKQQTVATTPVHRHMTTTEQRMREEEQIKAAARRGRSTQISQMPNDLTAGGSANRPGAVAAEPAVLSHQDVKERERQARNALGGNSGSAVPMGSRTTTQPIGRMMPSDLNNGDGTTNNGPSGEFKLQQHSNVSSTPRPTVIASHAATKDQERQARDLVHGTVTMSKPSSDVMPRDLRMGNNISAPSGEFTMPPPSSATVVSHEDVKQQERQSRHMGRVSGIDDGLRGGLTPPSRQQQHGSSATVAASLAPPPPAAAQRAVSDHEHAQNRISEEERIKQRERAARVTAMTSGASHVTTSHVTATASVLPSDLVAGTMEPESMSQNTSGAASVGMDASDISVLSSSNRSGAVPGSSPRTRRSARPQADADAKLKERARRPRGPNGGVASVAGASISTAGTPDGSAGTPGSSMSSKKGDDSMPDVMKSSAHPASTEGPVVIEEEVAQIPVGAVSVFTNGVVVQQQRGELTQLQAPPIADYQARDDGDSVDIERPEAYTENIVDRQAANSVGGATIVTDAALEQSLSAYTPGSGGSGGEGVATASMVKIDEEDDVPWYKSSEFRLCFCCVIIAAIVGAVVAAVLAGKDDDPTVQQSGPTPAPVTTDTESPSASPTVTPLDELRVATLRSQVVDGGITTADVLDDPNTPQHKAYIWLVRDDEFGWTDFGTDTLAERYILATFYFSLDGNNWLSSTGWLDPFIAHCNWEFVGCGADDQRVGVINTGGRPGLGQMVQNNLSGPLPFEIAYLSNLQELRVQGNSILDIEALGQGMPKLDILDLGGSPIRDFSVINGENFPSLQTLSIRDCDFGGQIPPEMFTLSKILSLAISGNAFTGTLTTELGGLPMLRDFVFDNNNLEGNITAIIDSIYDRSTVRALIGDSNSLTGTLPSSVGDFNFNQGILSFRSNDLSGTIPTEVGLMSNLHKLILSSNFNIESQLPSEIGQMGQLRELMLDNTFLDGTIPVEFERLNNLERLGFGGTLLQGNTDVLCDIPDLVIVPGFDLECTCPGCTIAV